MSDRLSYAELFKLVRDRAVVLSETIESGEAYAHVPKDTRKRILDVMEEVDRIWKQGKPVQRRVQTVLGPLMWQAQTGIEPEKLDLGSATEIEHLMQPGWTQQWDNLVNIAAHAVLGSIQIHQRFDEETFNASVQIPFVALFIYMSARRFGTPSVFELRDNLAEKLVLTDVDAIKPSDVQLPLPGFYIQMPPGALELWNDQTGWHQASFVGVAESLVEGGPRRGRTLDTLFWCEPNARSTSATDDNAQVSFISLPEDYEGSLEDYEASIKETVLDRVRVKRPFVKWQGRELGFEDGFKLLRKFVVNFCLYLSSPNPDIQPTGGKQTWKEVVDKAEDARKHGPRARRQVTIGKNFSLWDVGRRTEKLQRMLTATDILVRGHWRPQAHGPRWSLRKIIWIEPFVRRPTGADAAGHEYRVEGESPKRTSRPRREDPPVEENPYTTKISAAVRERISPILGDKLGREVAASVGASYTMPLDERPVDLLREALAHRMRHAHVYNAEHVTPEMFEQALAAVEDL